MLCIAIKYDYLKSNKKCKQKVRDKKTNKLGNINKSKKKKEKKKFP